ncbi:caspase family protein [Bosea caraganae]|nr:caspase family protein [Bosea caraganae]
MRSRLTGVVLLAALALLCAAASASAKQIAIVIGNDTYAEVTPLNAAVNDARAMGDGLTKAGFQVELVENGTKRQMSRALSVVENKIEPGDTVVFHYSGHGFEIDGQNWLLPIDVPAAREGEAGLIKDESFNAADIVERFRARGAGTVVAILDACRNNPFARSGTRALGGGTRGLANMEASGGVFIMFSAGSKQLALDKLTPADPTPTSIFVRSVLPLLGRTDLSLIDIAKEAQQKVRELARSVGHEQIPAYYDGIVGRVTLTGALPTTRLEPQAPVAQQPKSAAEDVFWQSIRDSNQAAMYEAYLAQVGKNTFSGTYRQLAERKLASLRLGPADSPPSPAQPQQLPPALTIEKAPPQAPAESASGPEITACDAAAADARDPDKPAEVAGLDLDLRTAPAGLAACGKAVAVAGAPRRAFYQLSRAYEANNNALKASENLQKAADLGHPLALYALAERSLTGQGQPKDASRAMSLFYRAADAGVNAAIVRIGAMYANGQGADRDYIKAVAFYNLALKADEPSVYAELGLLYLNGRGVVRDKRKACELFAQGAGKGNAAAAQNAASFCS